MSAQTHPTDRVLGDTRRHLLLAVDGSDGSRRAVMYVADFFGDYQDVSITLLSILAEPPEDLFPAERERARWLEEQKRSRDAMFADYRKILAGAGLPEERVATHLVVRHCTSVGDAILEEQEKLRCCIVVIGRRGLSRHEEFLLGSTSNRILHRASRCAVLVVQ